MAMNGRLPLAGLVIAFSILASTCALLIDDGFPSWLSHVESSIDLDTVIAYDPKFPRRGIIRLEYIPFTAMDGTDASTIMAYTHGQGNEALLAFDSRLSYIASWLYADPALPGNIGPVLARTVHGMLSGNLEFNPSALNDTPQAIAASTPPRDSRVFHTEGPPRNYLVENVSTGPGEHVLRLSTYDGNFTQIGAHIDRSLDADKSRVKILDAEYCGGKYRLLVETKMGGYVLSFSSESELLVSSTFIDDTSSEITGPFPLSDSMAWLSEDGVIVYDRNIFVLSRFVYGQEGAIADTLSLGNDVSELLVVSFDTSGAWWFMHDRSTGLLYKMRTWWP